MKHNLGGRISVVICSAYKLSEYNYTNPASPGMQSAKMLLLSIKCAVCGTKTFGPIILSAYKQTIWKFTSVNVVNVYNITATHTFITDLKLFHNTIVLHFWNILNVFSNDDLYIYTSCLAKLKSLQNFFKWNGIIQNSLIDKPSN